MKSVYKIICVVIAAGMLLPAAGCKNKGDNNNMVNSPDQPVNAASTTATGDVPVSSDKGQTYKRTYSGLLSHLQ